MNDQVLEVVSVSEERTSIDNRKFKTIGVIPADMEEGGLISTRDIHKRNIWNRQPLGGDEHPYYNKIKVGSRILGKIVTLPTKPYYIPNDRGKYVDGEGNHYNIATYKTYIPFQDDTAESMRRNEGLDPTQTAEESAQYPSNMTVDVIGELEIDPNAGGPSPERDREDMPTEQEELVNT